MATDVRVALRKALPHAINFRFLPPRTVDDPVWDEIAVELEAAIALGEDAAPRQPEPAPETTSIDGVSGTGLEDAWREVEAALPEGWFVRQIVNSMPPEPAEGFTGSWYAFAERDIETDERNEEPTPTPAAALRALAARLLAKDGDRDG